MHSTGLAMPYTATQQIVMLDVARFMAALSVLAFHFTFLVSVPHHTPFNVTKGLIAFDEISDFTKFGWIGVEVFFVISGFVITLSAAKSSPGKFAKSRFLRLVPAAWICASATLVIALVVRETGMFQLFARYLRSVFFIPLGTPIDGSYWTLGVEITFYVFVWLLLKFDRFRWLFQSIVTIGFLSVIFNVVVLATDNVYGWRNRLTDLLLFRHGCEFALGVIFYRLYIGPKQRYLQYLALAMLIGCLPEILFQASLHFGRITTAVEVAVLTATWLAGAGGLFLLIEFSDKVRFGMGTNSALRTLGLMTYPLYLIHQLAGSAVMLWVFELSESKHVALVGAVSFSMTASYFVVLGEKRVRELLNSLAEHMFSFSRGKIGSSAPHVGK